MDKINGMRTQKGWLTTDSPRVLAKSIVVEANELMECFLEQPYDIQAISKELADVLMYAFTLAQTFNLDIDQIITSKIAEVIERKYD